MENIIVEADQIANVSLPEQTNILVGHEEQFSQLKKQINNNKLPNAILLHGVRGIGKATFAFHIIREILLDKGNEAKQTINKQIAMGSHPNIYILRKKQNEKTKKFYGEIRIDDVREMMRKIRQTAAIGAPKICVIDAIDDCNQMAANALLKILEEPPKNSLFILISHQKNAILPTILSRTQQISFRPLSEEKIAQILKNANIAQSDIMQNAIELAKGRARRAFEALLLENLELLTNIQNWLTSEKLRENASHLELIEQLINSDEAEQIFAKNMLLDWIANEAKNCAIHASKERNKLASIINLWEKAQNIFANMQIYNLDKRQSYITIFDDIKTI